jgi:ferredoxin
VDKQSCQSSGRCVRAAPGAFALDADHLAEVRPGAAALGEDELLAVARACPAFAIHVFGESGEEREL